MTRARGIAYAATIVICMLAGPAALLALVVDPTLALGVGTAGGALLGGLGLAPALIGMGYAPGGWRPLAGLTRVGLAAASAAVGAAIAWAAVAGVDNEDYRACRASQARWRGWTRDAELVVHSVSGTDRVARGARCTIRIARELPSLWSCTRRCAIDLRCGEALRAAYTDGACTFQEGVARGFHAYGRAAAATRPELQLDEDTRTAVLSYDGRAGPSYRVELREAP